jgi:hypothetical protein
MTAAGTKTSSKLRRFSGASNFFSIFDWCVFQALVKLSEPRL